MSPGARQTRNIVQKQTLSLRQYFKLSILGMSNKEALDYVETELKDNPFLKKSEPSSVSLNPSQESVSDIIEKTATEDLDTLENALLEQIAFIYKKSSMDYSVAQEVIYNLDEKGFLKDSSPIVAKHGEAIFEKISNEIKHLSPLGSGSQDFEDYFLFCLKSLNLKTNSALYQNAASYLKLFLKLNDPQKVQSSLGFSDKDLGEILNALSQFQPYPRYGYSAKKTESIFPDAIIEIKKGVLTLKMNDEMLRQLELNDEYKEILSKEKSLSDEEKKYFLEKELRAKNLIDAFSYRHEMLKNIVLNIIDIQKDFLLGKSPHSKPFFMKTVAEKLLVHPSTITRLISGKYVECPIGLKPMRVFFSKEIHKGKNKEEIINLIQSVIKEFDDAQKPLSDKKIAEACAKLGMPIAVRTVAKYRQTYRIGSSRKRKKL